MKKFLPTLFFFASILVLAAGCASGEDATANGAATNSGDSKMNSSTTAELAKCEMCGKEVPKEELEMHDGKMWCKACMASHTHG